MHEIVVLSGKGGTGKTSVTAAFAACAGSAVLADADVDASDLYLVARPAAGQPEPFMSGYKAQIEPERCSGCLVCRDACRFDAIQVDRARPSIDRLSCEGCGVCEWVCPDRAIRMYQPVAGQIWSTTCRFGPIVHARLGVGGENSGKLVAQVRRLARTRALETGIEWLLVDGPPGIGCPVISSVTGADHVVAVTEATVSGEHDLERLWTLIDHFGVPASLIINRADIAPTVAERIAAYAQTRGVHILGRLPYDPVFTQAQLAGLSVVEYSNGPAAIQLHACWQQLLDIVSQDAHKKE